MGLRETVNTNKTVGYGLIGILLLAGVLIAVLSARSPDEPEPPRLKQLWFYDLETERLFAATADHVPPFVNDQGHASVVAVVLTCGGRCAPEAVEGKTPAEVAQSGLRVGYLQRLTAGAKQDVEQRRDTVSKPEHVGLLVMNEMVFKGEFREVSSTAWLGSRDPEMNRLIERLREQCGPNPRPCYPE